MKNFALYDKDGKIKKIISTTRKDVIEKNVPTDCAYIEVASNVKTNTHEIVEGGAVILKDVKPGAFIKPKTPMIDPKSIVTEKEIDDCKDIEGLKFLLKKMIGPKWVGKR